MSEQLALAPPCERCGPLSRELAHALEELAESRERCAALLAGLAEWNRAAAAALAGRGDGAAP